MARYTYRWVLVQMEVIIIIITSYQQLACSTQHGLRQQIRRFNVFFIVVSITYVFISNRF